MADSRNQHSSNRGVGLAHLQMLRSYRMFYASIALAAELQMLLMVKTAAVLGRLGSVRASIDPNAVHWGRRARDDAHVVFRSLARSARRRTCWQAVLLARLAVMCVLLLILAGRVVYLVLVQKGIISDWNVSAYVERNAS